MFELGTYEKCNYCGYEKRYRIMAVLKCDKIVPKSDATCSNCGRRIKIATRSPHDLINPDKPSGDTGELSEEDLIAQWEEQQEQDKCFWW